MAKYVVLESTYVLDRYYAVDSRVPMVFELEDSYPPSRRWLPMDKGAQAALAKLGVRAAIVGMPSPAQVIEGLQLPASRKKE